MTLLTVTKRSGEQTEIEADAGSVMEALRNHGVDEVLALCGGALACATCHVFVDPDDLSRLPEPSSDERNLVETSSYVRQHSRLSCQIMLSPGLKSLSIQIAPEE